jgi:hypothetical protein
VHRTHVGGKSVILHPTTLRARPVVNTPYRPHRYFCRFKTHRGRIVISLSLLRLRDGPAPNPVIPCTTTAISTPTAASQGWRARPMGYLLLSPSPSPSPPVALRHRSPAGRHHRARRGAAIVASSSSSSDGGPSQAARHVLARRAVLLGVSALPLLRDTAAKAAAPSSGGLVTG